MIPLLEDEKIVADAAGKNAILTDIRIVHKSESGITSISLDRVSCYRVYHKNNLALLLLGIGTMLIGLVYLSQESDGYGFLIMLAGAILATAYFMTRVHVVSIFSDSGEPITFRTKGMNLERVMEFINQVEKAKIEYKSGRPVSF